MSSDLQTRKKRIASEDPEDAEVTAHKKVQGEERDVLTMLPFLDDVVPAGQKFLADVFNVFGGVDPQQDVPGVEIRLPLPPLGFGQRLRFEDSIHGTSLHCVRREAFDTLYDALRARKISYLNGPLGMGKSFALYFLYCKLSATPNTRVLYINSCEELCDKEGVQYLFQAAAAAFANDPECLANINQHAASATWASMLRGLSRYCNTNNLLLWAIFDQHNKIPPQDRKGMLSVLRLWNCLQPGRCHFVVSASANNEEEGLREVPSVPFASGFTDDEFKTWCRSRNFFLPANFTPLPQALTSTEDAALDKIVALVKPITGLIPRELDTLKLTHDVNQGIGSLGDLLSVYATSRIASIRLDLMNFEKTRVTTPEEQQVYAQACYALLTGNPFAGPFLMDRRIMFVDWLTVNQRTLTYIRPVLPLVNQVVLAHTSTIKLCDLVRTAFQSPELTNDAKGRTVELYLVHEIANTRSVQLPLRRIMFNQNSNIINRSTANPIKEDILALNDLHVEYVVGRGVPPSAPSASTLYIPYDSNYPDADFFIWDHHVRSLFVVQVTMRHDPQGHTHTWTASASHFRKWLKFLTPLFRDTYPKGEAWQQKVWITRAPPTNTAFEGHLFLDIHDKEFIAKLQKSGRLQELLNFIPHPSTKSPSS